MPRQLSRRALLAFLLVAAGLGIASSAPLSAATAVDCSYYTKQGTAINKAQLVWTKIAYSDNTITPEEQQTAGLFTDAIAANTKALAACIGGAKAPLLTNVTFSGTTWSTASGHSVRISWSVDRPSSIELTFQQKIQNQEIPVAVVKVATGRKSVTFSGKAGSVQIKPGRYLVGVVATTARGAESKAVAKPFSVTP